MTNHNPHTGSAFDNFLAEDGLLEACTAVAIKRVLARQIEAEMKQQGITKTAMAKHMNTSRSQLDRLLNPEKTGVSIELMQRAATIIGRRLRIELI